VCGTCTGNVRQHPLAFFHDGQANQAGRLVFRRSGKLGGATDGGRVIGVFANEEEDGEFIIAQGDVSGHGVGLRGCSVMGATAFDSQGDEFRQVL
jgi:serine phosphatase RsbU (regulator of sigma subunit)